MLWEIKLAPGGLKAAPPLCFAMTSTSGKCHKMPHFVHSSCRGTRSGASSQRTAERCSGYCRSRRGGTWGDPGRVRSRRWMGRPATATAARRRTAFATAPTCSTAASSWACCGTCPSCRPRRAAEPQPHGSLLAEPQPLRSLGLSGNHNAPSGLTCNGNSPLGLATTVSVLLGCAATTWLPLG